LKNGGEEIPSPPFFYGSPEDSVVASCQARVALKACHRQTKETPGIRFPGFRVRVVTGF